VKCKIWPQKLETSLYRLVHEYSDTFNRLGVDHQRYRRTERQAEKYIIDAQNYDSNSVRLTMRAKNEI